MIRLVSKDESRAKEGRVYFRVRGIRRKGTPRAILGPDHIDLNEEAFGLMPKGEGSEAGICLENLSKPITTKGLIAQTKLQRRRFADVYLLATVHSVAPTLAERYPYFTLAPQPTGRCCVAAFSCSETGRLIEISFGNDEPWDEHWWVAYLEE